MSPNPEYESLSLEQLKTLDSFCAPFDLALQEGKTISIEAMLDTVPDALQETTFAEVLHIELEYQSERGLDVDRANYLSRFPQYADSIDQAFGKHATGSNLSSPLPRRPAMEGSELQQLLPGFDIQEIIGYGGMGSVYKARQKMLDRIVAIKITSDWFEDHKRATIRFLREVQVLAKLKHTNIVTAYDAGQVQGRPYLVMEYVEGKIFRSISSPIHLCFGALVPMPNDSSP